MKLGALNSAIREPENVHAALRLDDGRALHLTLQKTPLIAALTELFVSKATETGLCLDNGRYLKRDHH
jgi:hypothetical protein